MSYNGSGTFQINTSGQPVVAGTVISSTAFNALTADLATGLSTAITKDGQTTTTARIPFAAGINSSLTTDSSSTTTGSIITAGGVGIVKNLYVGANTNIAGTLGVTGVATFSAAPIYSSLTASSAVATDASKALVSVTNTGTGNNVLATSPTLVTPILGTPQSGTLTNATGLPLSTGVTGVLPEANGGTGTTTGYYGFKNRIINGAMGVSQRYATASTSLTTSLAYYIDRFTMIKGTAGATATVAQSSTAPTGFANSMLITVGTGASPGGADLNYVAQLLEGNNVFDLSFGTASASSVTFSFWVRSSLTGTFSGCLNNGVTSASGRSYPFNYTISVANTWEQKTITIAGDTSGTWATTTSAGMQVVWDLGSGSGYAGTANAWTTSFYPKATSSSNLIATSGATFYITGVQLEKGSTATSFDYRPYGTEFALCQRYFNIYSSSDAQFPIGIAGSTTTVNRYTIPTPVTMRATPTVATSGTLVLYDNVATTNVTSIATIKILANFVSFDITVASGLTQYRPYMLLIQGTTLSLTSEL
jgi:hypothetical protein